jgi:hypothetical protein
MRESPVQKVLRENGKTYGECERGAMMIPKNYNKTPHWD